MICPQISLGFELLLGQLWGVAQVPSDVCGLAPHPRYQESRGYEPARGGPCREAVLHVRVGSPAAPVPPYGLVFPCRSEEGLPTENMDVMLSGV